MFNIDIYIFILPVSFSLSYLHFFLQLFVNCVAHCVHLGQCFPSFLLVDPFRL